jgi:transposase
MKILALDLGKYKTVACDYDLASGGHEFETIATKPQSLHDLLVAREPDRIVIEICSIAGWVCDLARALGIEIEVANTNDDRWRWKKIKKKSDREDALKTARLSALNQLELVHVPEQGVRQWRALINYRQQLLRRRNKIKNHIRDLLLREAILLPRGRSAWTLKGLLALAELSRPLDQVAMEELWRGELGLELQELRQAEAPLQAVEKKLDALAQTNQNVQLLQTIPGVGPRLAEAMAALIDDPQRFQKGKEVGAYIGMVPKQLDSGETVRNGHITRHGSRLVRALLVEVSWLGLRYNPWVREIYERTRAGKSARRKVAIVAVGRRLLIRSWAMLRDQQPWQGPAKLSPARKEKVRRAA